MSKGVVLSVDDDEVNQVVIASFLESAGYTVQPAFTGAESIQYLERAYSDEEIPDKPARPDIILMDVVMPGMDGFVACKRIRDRFPATIPIILISARYSLNDVIHGLNFGLANDYLTKPFDRTILLAKIEARIAIKRLVDIAELDIVSSKSVDLIPRPLYQELDDLGKGCVLIFLKGEEVDRIPAVLNRLLEKLSQHPSIICREIQFGLCVFTSKDYDELLNFCCNVFGSASGPTSVIRNALFFCLGEDDVSISELLTVSICDVPLGTVQSTEKFKSCIGQESIDKFFPGSVAVRRSDSPRRDDLSIRSMPDIDAFLEYAKNGYVAPIDFDVANGFVNAIHALEVLFFRDDPSENKENEFSEDISFLQKLFATPISDLDFAVERYRVRLAGQVVELESQISELRAGLKFEGTNLDVLRHRYEKALRYKEDLSAKLALRDDLDFRMLFSDG